MATKPAGRPPGRPSMLVDPTRAAILRLVTLGMKPKRACVSVGISYRAFTGWIQRGKADLEAGKESAFSLFILEIEKAKADGLERRLACIDAAVANGEWKAAHAMNQALFPEEYGTDRAELRAMRREMAELRKMLADIQPAPPPENPPEPSK